MPTLREHESAAEFDAYAAAYDAGIDNPVKRCLGTDVISFIEVKVDWLLRAMRRYPQLAPTSAEMRLLDYGCGAGTFMDVLRERGFAGYLAGCDVSATMLAEARRRWVRGPMPQLCAIENAQALFAPATFDIVVVSSVLHHVEPSSRPLVYQDVLRLLKPGGCVCIFEHNPYNPLTQWVVRHTAIDKNAVLLRPAEVRTSLARAGATQLDTQYLMFFPPRCRQLRGLEKLLHRVPCGAQYAVWAESQRSRG